MDTLNIKNSDYELWVAELKERLVAFIDLWIIHGFYHGRRPVS
jgi:hypothetical protein